jgi:hypothetical protein
MIPRPHLALPRWVWERIKAAQKQEERSASRGRQSAKQQSDDMLAANMTAMLEQAHRYRRRMPTLPAPGKPTKGRKGKGK